LTYEEAEGESADEADGKTHDSVQQEGWLRKVAGYVVNGMPWLNGIAGNGGRRGRSEGENW